MKTDIIDKIDSEKKVIQIKENRFETIHDGKSIMHSFSNSSLLRFVIKILKYPFKKYGSFYRGILKNIGRLLYKKAPFSNINLMIDSRFNKPQYEYVEYNKWYQHGLAIKTYAGFGNKYRLPVGLEHGTHLEDVYDGYELQEEKDNLPGLFVFSENSKKIYSKHTTKEIIVIGPYIHYVKSLLNKNDFLKEKGRLGKSLLIIPNHSDVISQIVYDNHSYLKKIKNIANDFDSVRVCLHWNDVQNKFYDHYREMGWECVSAGHETNNYFLSRLRSIIELSDFVLSDNITTALGYSIYLKKPVMLIKSEAHAVITSKRKGLDETKINKLVNGPVNELFYDCFSVYSDNINNDQLELVEQYWGLSHLKTKKEMREIIMHFDEQLENGRLNSKRGQDYVQNA